MKRKCLRAGVLVSVKDCSTKNKNKKHLGLNLGKIVNVGFLITPAALQGLRVLYEFQKVFETLLFWADCLMAQMRSSLQLPSRHFDLQQPADSVDRGSDGLMCQQDLNLRAVSPPTVNNSLF